MGIITHLTIHKKLKRASGLESRLINKMEIYFGKSFNTTILKMQHIIVVQRIFSELTDSWKNSWKCLLIPSWPHVQLENWNSFAEKSCDRFLSMNRRTDRTTKLALMISRPSVKKSREKSPLVRRDPNQIKIFLHEQWTTYLSISQSFLQRILLISWQNMHPTT